ncbi:MAG: hypothetical protein ABFD14_10290 [Anaerolineaceae bacterium]
MPSKSKDIIKEVLGQIPFSAELYWLIRQRKKPFNSHFSLKSLETKIPGLLQETQKYQVKAPEGKRIFIFTSLHYWIEHAVLMGLSLAAQGHKVTFAYLPYAEWQTPINKFDLRRQDIYAARILKQLEPTLRVVSLMKVNGIEISLPQAVQNEIVKVTEYDTQYTLQVEEIDTNNETYQLRFRRNQAAAKAVYRYLNENKFDAMIVPNGTIQEMGVVYRVARYLKIPVTTYEFGDQRQTIWLAQNNEIMRQDTDAMWNACKHIPLQEKEQSEIRNLFKARQKADLYGNFARRWQKTPAVGSQKIRKSLGLDERPVVLLPTNVLGDSLTLGRNIFSKSMTEWISRTVQYFAGREDAQLIIRVHPGEVLTHGLAMADVVRDVLPVLPEHIRLIEPQDPTNTYDLIEIADLGLVYTTTVGMEMAMTGVPVIVSGYTHYRNRGFTQDPESWVDYYKTLGRMLENPDSFKLTPEIVDTAWQYAYRFFFDFARPYPWHLVRVWEDFEQRPFSQVFNQRGKMQYQDTFDFLTGKPINWENIFTPEVPIKSVQTTGEALAEG